MREPECAVVRVPRIVFPVETHEELRARDVERVVRVQIERVDRRKGGFGALDLGKGDKWERIYEPEPFDYLKEPKSPIRLYPHIGVVQEFVDSILERRPPKVGGAEGRAAVEICEACLISARMGQAIRLPLP